MRFTGVILKRKFNFQDVLPTRKVSHPQSDNFFIAKCDPNTVRVASILAKNTKNRLWRPNGAFNRGDTEAQS